ncbi:type II toxin-antitoxin system RelE family toxin [Desulfoscipio sp. XC116]|uniref:type II toxin-antitoxin system RelE family toxin n=1 Tax=Desulfoscipio sp. XC116 TaxID=3144975 RepID=UPI00325BC8B0
MQIEYSKQPKKYLKKADANTRAKLEKAIEGLKELEGNIQKIKGTDLYRLKIEHYRIGFSVDINNNIILVEAIHPRGEFYKHI